MGIAISANRVVAWLPRESGSGGGAALGDEWEQQIAPLSETASEWTELEIALRALSAESGGGTLFISLLPPLVQLRSIALPPVDEDDAARLVARSVGKYFVGGREPQVVGVRVQEGGKGQATDVLACAASMRVVKAIRSAAEDAGWKIGRVVPAHSAWLAGAEHVWAKSDALVDHGRIVVIDGDRTDVIAKSGGKAESARHIRGLHDDGDKLLELLAARSPGAQPSSKNGLRPVGIIGDDGLRRKLAPVLRERGLQPLEPEGVYAKVMSSAPLAAAHFAPLTQELELVSEETKSAREEQLRKVAVGLAVAAGLLFIAGLGVQRWGLQKELASLHAKRDSVRQAVGVILNHQNQIGSMGAPIAALDSLRTSAVRWSVVISDIARVLPGEAFLLGMRAKGDTVNLDGQGRDAGIALEQLRRAPSLQDVRQSGQISRLLDTARFDVIARVRRPAQGGNDQ